MNSISKNTKIRFIEFMDEHWFLFSYMKRKCHTTELALHLREWRNIKIIIVSIEALGNQLESKYSSKCAVLNIFSLITLILDGFNIIELAKQLKSDGRSYGKWN